ncbi:MAG: MBL fold metallo-hydrolase [Chloroflexi bacterium]|nr:MBL fold metallo-hydrolase [Chloroflexota bacterium]
MTKLVFLGTKGEIEESTETHRYHASFLLVSDETKLLIDHGDLQKYTLDEIRPSAVLITHAHPDHYAWLKKEVRTEAPVYLTQHTLGYGKFRPANPWVIEPGEPFQIGPFQCQAYAVIHSIRCPAVGYRIQTSDKTLVYNPDLVDIVDKEKILQGVQYYVGDGSAIRANLVRRRGDQLFGHTRITTQINWCNKYGISNIVFTHLGKETIEKEEEFKKEHPEVVLAYDGMELAI